MIELWQVYAKVKGGWVPQGEPMLKKDAEAIVAEMWIPLIEFQKNQKNKKTKKKSPVLYTEPHCVPL
jgi:uncharacterized protein YbdZ (MbtH family)